MDNNKRAIIIGAGPAGLTAAYELLQQSGIKPIILEASEDIGGISKTINYKGNRIDIGGHRFFSKSNRVMEWWQQMMPLQSAPSIDDKILGIQKELNKNGDADPEKIDVVMLLRERLSRILYLRKFYNYPISLSKETITNLGLSKMAKIGIGYAIARIAPIKPEKSLEDFFINRFGKELYETFFKDYTHKVWGVHCNEIKPEWGAQRIKGLSISKAILHALKSKKSKDINQKDVETSLIERFMYPKLGPGQLWEVVAQKIIEQGGEIRFNQKVVAVNRESDQITSVQTESGVVDGDYFISTMPVRDLIDSLGESVPKNVKTVSDDLRYRDFITVGLLMKKLKIKNRTSKKTLNDIVPDNWIYIQESDVKVGRLQVFNNWSPYMVANRENAWIGLEYFCNEGDELWSMEDGAFLEFAKEEMVKIGVIDAEDFLDGVVIRVPKTYPAYFGSYEQFDLIKEHLDSIQNLYLVGRNGMHRYNNMDHSMLSAMESVKNIIEGRIDKSNIWNVNTEDSYHESK